MPEPHPLPPALRGAPFTTRSARDHGVAASRLRRRDLAAPFRGVRRAIGDEGWMADVRAYAALMPPHAVLSHATAARLLGIPLPTRLEDDPRVHVTALGGRAPRGPGVAGHTTTRMPEVRALGMLRVTSPARTWADLSALLSLDELVIAGDRLRGLPSPLATADDLVDAVHRHAGRRGRAALGTALDFVRPGSRSPRETRAMSDAEVVARTRRALRSRGWLS
ncbi:hypothetical protein ACIGCK_10655 [Microbacterium sp. NPDC078428]|uniref:hypothetical protein n=1 Tax=Microbacterium sp. NPDC078428 TaxID=3364190 RepID=UPI0037CAC2BA